MLSRKLSHSRSHGHSIQSAFEIAFHRSNRLTVKQSVADTQPIAIWFAVGTTFAISIWNTVASTDAITVNRSQPISIWLTIGTTYAISIWIAVQIADYVAYATTNAIAVAAGTDTPSFGSANGSSVWLTE